MTTVTPLPIASPKSGPKSASVAYADMSDSELLQLAYKTEHALVRELAARLADTITLYDELEIRLARTNRQSEADNKRLYSLRDLLADVTRAPANDTSDTIHPDPAA